MADDTSFSLKRWSRRKLEAAREVRQSTLPVGGEAAVSPVPPVVAASNSSTPATGAAPGGPVPAPATAPELPEVESLSFDSDFTAFMQPKVEEGLKRQALRKLFSDPRFNVMDGLDVYIDDYSIPDPISEAVVRASVGARYIFAPPQTRINAEGLVEDVPIEPIAAATDLPQLQAADAVPPASPETLPTVPPSEAATAQPASADAADAMEQPPSEARDTALPPTEALDAASPGDADASSSSDRSSSR